MVANLILRSRVQLDLKVQQCVRLILLHAHNTELPLGSSLPFLCLLYIQIDHLTKIFLFCYDKRFKNNFPSCFILLPVPSLAMFPRLLYASAFPL